MKNLFLVGILSFLTACSNHLVHEGLGMKVEQACVNGIMNSTCGHRVTFEDGEVVQGVNNGGGLLDPAVNAAIGGAIAASLDDNGASVNNQVQGSSATANADASSVSNSKAVNKNKQHKRW